MPLSKMDASDTAAASLAEAEEAANNISKDETESLSKDVADESTKKSTYPSGSGNDHSSDVSRADLAAAAALSVVAPRSAATASTNIASHAPIRMKLTTKNRKTRKRKQHPDNAAAGNTQAAESSEDEEEDDATTQSNASKKPHHRDEEKESLSPEQCYVEEDKVTVGEGGKDHVSVDKNSLDTSSKGSEEQQTPSKAEDLVGNKNMVQDLAEHDDSSKKDAASSQHQKEHHSGLAHSPHRYGGNSPEQPEGWRVKLYRLNMDGSWDDCGTGRIVCLYRTQSQHQQQNHNKFHDTEYHNPNDSIGHNNNPLQPSTNIRPEPHQTTDQWLYQETGEATLCVQAELTKANRQTRVLLRTRILLRDPYQRQGDNIITWCEPFYGQENNLNDNDLFNDPSDNGMQQPGGGVDLALSFQDNAGCLDIWRQITQVQSRAAELLRGLPNDDSVQRMAAAIAAQHHAHLQQQPANGDGQSDMDMVVWGNNGGHPMHDGSPQGGEFMLESQVHLPDPPTLANLEQIADSIAAIHNVQQREAMAIAIAKNECTYLRALLALFPAAEERNDYGKLATLAACVKTILLLNEPSILELIVAVADIFEQVCSCLEYDPDLREKANHGWFLRERVKFRTVVAMDNLELVSAIHRSFRANYLRDTLLRPTMDESSLSTLSSLQTFSHADVVKGVTMSPNGEEVSLTESYLVRVIRMLGVELHAICVLEWMEVENPSSDFQKGADNHDDLLSGAKDPSIVVGENPMCGTTWKQYLAPQDSSLASRRLRRRGCLNFLRELFNMVRLSLQQNDKDDFFSVISTLDVDLVDDISDNISQTSQLVEVGSVASTVKCDQAGATHVEIPPPASPVSLLSLLGNALADPNMDATETGAVLEIIAGVAMHDPSFIRRHCVEHHIARKEKEKQRVGSTVPSALAGRPDPNEKKQLIHVPPPNDLLASLLFLLNVTTDAGVLLQATEIMRIILDTDIIGDSGSITAGFKDESEGVPPGHPNGARHDQHTQPTNGGVATNDQKQFFSLFYEHYMEWLVAPFQFTLLHPARRVPENVLKKPFESKAMQAILASWRSGVKEDDSLLRIVPFDAIRSSFAIELLSFCVRAHLYRMKFFLLKSRVLGNVLSLLRPNIRPREISGGRCLKLASLRFLRSILSVHDEFYHRHIIQHDLFGPVFAAFRENPVGDNLVSSSIVEMCDYIHNENMKSLIEYIVTKHLTAENPENEMPRLEDVSRPYVRTLTVLREAYEANKRAGQQNQPFQGGMSPDPKSPRYFASAGLGANHPAARVLSGKALEDQRKFQEADEEESYFESDHVDVRSPDRLTNPAVPGALKSMSQPVPMAVDEVDAGAVTYALGETSPELHRTPRMFSLAQAPLLNNLDEPQSPPLTEKVPWNAGETTEEESPPSIDASCSITEGPKSDPMEEDNVEPTAANVDSTTEEMEQ